MIVGSRSRSRSTPIDDFPDPKIVRADVEKSLLDRHFVPPDPIDPKLVIDIGCWEGVTSLIFAELWPEADVIGVELDHENVVEAVVRVNDEPRVTIVNLGVAGASGRASVPGISSNLRSITGGDQNEVVTMNELIQLYGTGDDMFVKMDIEGKEFEAISSWDGMGVRWILIDCHPEYGVDPHQLMLKLWDLGFHGKTLSGHRVWSWKQ